MVAQIPIGYRDRYGDQFQGPVITGGQTGNYGAAAGIVDINNAYKSLTEKHDYDGIISNEYVNDANEFATKMQIEGGLLKQKQISDAEIAAAKYSYKQGMKGLSAQENAQQTAGAIGTVANVFKTALPLITSDETIKNTIEKIEDATCKLRALRPVSYYYNEEYSSSPERQHHGFIAQQYRHVLPDATYFDESIGKLCIDTGDLIGILVRGFQELDTRVTRMEAQRALAGVK